MLCLIGPVTLGQHEHCSSSQVPASHRPVRSADLNHPQAGRVGPFICQTLFNCLLLEKFKHVDDVEHISEGHGQHPSEVIYFL